MAAKLDNTQKEDLRRAVLEFLAARDRLAFTPQSIRRIIAHRQYVDFEITTEDVVSACNFLRGLGFAQTYTKQLGATETWKVTSVGILAVERGEI